MTLQFCAFANTINRAGLTARECTPDHWQVIGGPLLVNYYPNGSRGPTMYVAGTVRGVRGATVEDVIKAATTAPPLLKPFKKPDGPLGRRARQKIKRRLLASDPKCHWCGTPLDAPTATLEHRIPRARGGSDGTDNHVLACRTCNETRGKNMPELEAQPAEQQPSAERSLVSRCCIEED